MDAVDQFKQDVRKGQIDVDRLIDVIVTLQPNWNRHSEIGRWRSVNCRRPSNALPSSNRRQASPLRPSVPSPSP